MKKIKRKLKIFFKNAKITEFFQKNTEKGAKIQEIQRKCKNTEQILKYRVIESSVKHSLLLWEVREVQPTKIKSKSITSMLFVWNLN